MQQYWQCKDFIKLKKCFFLNFVGSNLTNGVPTILMNIIADNRCSVEVKPGVTIKSICENACSHSLDKTEMKSSGT
jgi:hypothetical protein